MRVDPEAISVIGLLFGVCFLEAWTNLLSRPLFIYLKDDLHLDPSDETTFSNVTLIPWMLQGLIGLLWDATIDSLSGSMYMWCALVTFVGAGLRIAFAWYPRTLVFLYIGYVSVEFCTISSIAMSKRVLATAAQGDNKESTLYWTWTGIAGNLIRVASTFVSGYLADQSIEFSEAFEWSGFGFAFCALGMLVLWRISILRQAPLVPDSQSHSPLERPFTFKQRIVTSWRWLRSQKAVRSDADNPTVPLWSLATLLFILSCAPSASTGMLYYVVDEHHVSNMWLAIFTVVGLVTGICTLCVYRRVAHRFSLTSMLFLGYTFSIACAYFPSLFLVHWAAGGTVVLSTLILQNILGTPCSILMATAFYIVGVKSAPEPIRAFAVSCLVAILYCASVVSGQVSSRLLAALRIKTGSYKQLPLLLHICAGVQCVWLVGLLLWLRSYKTKKRDLSCAREMTEPFLPLDMREDPLCEGDTNGIHT